MALIPFETTSNLESAGEKHSTTEQAYLALLGLDETPKSPEELPAKIFLPKEVLGHMGEMSEFQDDNERQQFIFIDRRGNVVTSQLYLGSEDFSLTTLDSLKQLGRAYFGEPALLDIHTHTPPDEGVSPQDWAHIASLPRGSFMVGILNPYELRILVRTKESLKLPIWAGASGARRFIKQTREWVEDMSEEQMATIAESMGLGFYIYRNENDDDSWREGDFDKGVLLTKVKPEKR